MKQLLLSAALPVLVLLCAVPASAQPRGVTITIPTGVSFSVNNISVRTPGVPASMRISFTNTVNLKKNDSFNISVKADSAFFRGPASSQSIPASAVSWTATTPAGVASNGTMTQANWVQVFASPNEPSNGSVTLQWALGPLTAAGLRAGTHTLTVRWRLEAL